MDIDGLGREAGGHVPEAGFVRTAADFYRLDPEKLLELDGYGQVSVDNLLRSIEASKERPFGVVLFAIGIEGVGYVTGRTSRAASARSTRCWPPRPRRSPRRGGSARSWRR
jgi:DNA ligase (NAD+)